MPDQQIINYTRIKKFVKKYVDCKISSELYPEIERFIISLIDKLIQEAKERMEMTGKKTLHKRFLKLSERYIELGRNRDFTHKEIENLVRKSFNDKIWIREGVIEIMRGYIYEQLEDTIKQAKKALDFSSDRMLKAKHFRIYANY
ncbi:MAG: hypothetical protein ACTSRP_15735 [Candidatus Helarchaeota archaeon]